MLRWLHTTAVVLLVCAGCRERPLVDASGAVYLRLPERPLTERRLEFGLAWAGLEARTATVELVNEGHAALPIQWTFSGEPYATSELPTVAPSGIVRIEVTFRPSAVGYRSGSLQVSSSRAASRLELTGEGKPVPPCEPTSACLESRFDVAVGSCVESQRADGTACAEGNLCVLGGVCQQGRCVGQAVDCDDQNACTVDVCNAATGCEHLPAPPCPGDGKCQVGVCDPQLGCQLAPAADGETCGPVQSCDRAQVCMAGSCVERDPPDGYLCAQASPCQGEGHCSGSTCVRPPPAPLGPAWSFDSAASGDPDGGVLPEQFHDLVLEASGAVSLSGFFFSTPRLRANTEAASVAQGPVRRCMLWNQRYVCADYPAAVNGKISALDLATGATLWTFDLRTERPDFVAATASIFMARMAVQGSDRLAALFEAYPRNAPSGSTNCRNYFLAVLDAQGHLVLAQKLEDPVLDLCNHPHPYGFAADSQGNVFASFSPTIASPAPLKPGSPTLVMSWTRDGLFRWKFTGPELVGGELGVATGLIYPENSKVALRTADGQAAFVLDEVYGRVVVTRSRTVPAPALGGTALTGYEAGTPAPRWTHALPPGTTFWSDQVRLAQWATRSGPRTVALTFTRSAAGEQALHAVETESGTLAFSCPLSLAPRTAPQLFEVADGSLALMEGAETCGKCDPPFASSSAAFHTVRTPLLSVAKEPWVGTFGGAGHDHREDVLPLPPAQ